MNDTKHPLQSLGIVGPLAAILVLTANHVKPGLGLTSADVAPAIDAGDALIGCLLGIVGRWRATKRVSLTLVALLCALDLALTACAAPPDAAVASAQPTIEMACWLAAAADAGFQTYAVTPSANAGVIADERQAIAGVDAICAAPPANAAQAIIDVLAAYKAIVAQTPGAAPSGA